MCLIHVYGPKSSALYPEFVEEITDAQQMIKTSESTIHLGDFSAHVKNDAGAWKGVLAYTAKLT